MATKETAVCKTCGETVRYIKVRSEKIAVDNAVICRFQVPGEMSRMENDIRHVIVVFGKRWGVEIDQNEEFLVTTNHRDTCGKKTLDGVWKTNLDKLNAWKEREEAAAERRKGDV